MSSNPTARVPRNRPASHGRGQGGHTMVIYYRGPMVLITDRTLEVLGITVERYAIAELRDVHIVPGAWRLRRREHELRATYHGNLVRLFSTRGERQVGQVRRGLLRGLG